MFNSVEMFSLCTFETDIRLQTFTTGKCYQFKSNSKLIIRLRFSSSQLKKNYVEEIGLLVESSFNYAIGAESILVYECDLRLKPKKQRKTVCLES